MPAMLVPPHGGANPAYQHQACAGGDTLRGGFVVYTGETRSRPWASQRTWLPPKAEAYLRTVAILRHLFGRW